MTGIKRSVILLTLLLALGVTAFAQKGVEPLAETATAAETQAWIAKTLGKNSSFTVDLTKKYLSDIKFDGCFLNYSMRTETRGSSIDREVTDDNANNAKDSSGGSSTMLMIKLNLADLNGETVQVQDLPDNKKMKALAMESVAGKMAVSMGAKSKNKPVEKPTIGIIVKADAAEALKAGFAQAIKLCKAPQ